MTDEEYMGLGLDEARAAAAAGDVPVGAVIVDEQTRAVLARGRNRRESDGDPTAHAEIVALREAARLIGHWRVEATLFVTQEPCPMCAGAIVNARVKRLVFGCSNPKAGAVITLYQIPTDARLNHRVEVVAGLRADECAGELSKFFAALRRGPDYQDRSR
jgi:tRNA(adenine34) deaminase